MSIIRNVHSSRSQDPRLSGQNGLCHMSSGSDLSLRTLHYIVVMARVWRCREVIFLCEELIAEGFPAEREFAGIIRKDHHQDLSF